MLSHVVLRNFSLSSEFLPAPVYVWPYQEGKPEFRPRTAGVLMGFESFARDSFLGRRHGFEADADNELSSISDVLTQT